MLPQEEEIAFQPDIKVPVPFFFRYSVVLVTRREVFEVAERQQRMKGS